MSSEDEKKEFMKRVTVLVDSREQKNEHITFVLKQLGVMLEVRKLDYGDYSFAVEGRDFSHSCVIERKAKIDELYGNFTHDRERIEKEFDTMSRNTVQCTLLLEGCKGWEHLKEFGISADGAARQRRKVRNIGATVYSTLQAWRCGNRYSFDVEFIPDEKKTALKMLELFFWFWYNFRKQTAPRREKK